MTFFIPFIASLLTALSAQALVENTTTGSPCCIACHISPSGGGILNDYGRSLSAEMMSTWKVHPGFERPFYGLGRNGKHFKWGGHFRTIQVRTQNDSAKVGRQFVMQNNVEFAARYLQAFVVGTVGTQGGMPGAAHQRGQFLSERHYLLWEVSESSQFRGGKFRQHFGINDPNHTRLVKQALGFDANSETYNLEFTRFYPWGEVNTSVGLGDFTESKSNLVLNYTHYAGGNSRIGGSLLIGRRRGLFGLNGVFPLGNRGFALSEANYERKNRPTGDGKDALYSSHLYGYRFFKGGVGHLVFEHGQADLSDGNTLTTAPGAGFRFLPLPHVELNLEYQRKRYASDSGNPEHRTFLLLHLYH